MKNIINLKAGESRATTMPAHSGQTAGTYTFTVSGLDLDYPTQWSVVGARDSAVSRQAASVDKVGTDQCIIHIPDDQGHEEKQSRIVNVSVIGMDSTSKLQVETKATLTLSIFTKPDEGDFSFYTHVPEHVTYNETTSTLSPTKVEIKAHLSENAKTTEEGRSNFTAVCVFDIQGSTKPVVLPMALSTGSKKVFHIDVTNNLTTAAAAMDNSGTFLECTYEIEIHKHHLEEYKDSYYQAAGGKFILERIKNA